MSPAPNVARCSAALAIWIVLLTHTTGCLIVPIPHHETASDTSRRIIRDEDTAFVTPGHTTREEIILRLGQPDLTRYQDRLFVYGWSSSTLGLFFAVASPGGQAAADYHEFWNPHYLIFEFGPSGQVRRCERRDVPRSKRPSQVLTEVFAAR